jgi:F-type H+-transporting ATPase subunit delta
VKNLSIARRYAKALLLIGQEDGNTQLYRDELDGVTRALAAQPDLQRTISNPLYNADGRRGLLSAVIQKLKPSKEMQQFLLLLFDKGRFGFIEEVNDFFQKLADEQKGVARASLVSATELSSDAVDKIREALAKRTGKDIILDVQQDPELIGGIVTKIGDLVLDGSIKTQLVNMRESLKRGESV